MGYTKLRKQVRQYGTATGTLRCYAVALLLAGAVPFGISGSYSIGIVYAATTVAAGHVPH